MAGSRPLLERLLNAHDLTTVVPRLPPEVLHRVIQTCALEDCAELAALATTAQLARIFDLDLWRVRTPGVDEEFDADRFGVWIAVLMESGAAVAAAKLVGLDIDVVVAGLAQHAAVFDHAAISSYTTLDDEHVPGRPMNRGLVAEIGGYVIEARRTSAWEPIVDLLTCLAAEHREYFDRSMRGCIRLSNGTGELDGLHELLQDADQNMFDLACAREARRERQGYVTPAQAHAFLRGGRDVRLDAARPPQSAIARAYFRAFAEAMDADSPRESGGAPESNPALHSEPAADGIDGFVGTLREAGLLTPQPRALLGAGDGQASHLSFIRAHASAHPSTADELAYLANVVLAGCFIQERPFTSREASDAVAATCNLGLENWPSQWSDPDLVTAFQVGWTILHRDVCMSSAERLIHVLAEIRCIDRDIQLRLDGLRHELAQRVRDREPWRTRNALDVLIMFDAPSWAALCTLVAECPVMHAALGASRQRRVNATDYVFISGNSQIATVHEFMASLPSILTT